MNAARASRLLGIVALSALVASMPAPSATAAGSVPPQLDLRLSVVGNRLVDGAGATVHLRGVDRSGLEYACVQGWGLADGPMTQASVNAMLAWHINAVRLPLNEDCWLDINGVRANFAGTPYRDEVERYVAELHRDGIVAILDLHWNAPGRELATGQQDMADEDHSPAFWSSVATTFRASPGVIFDLYNEPHSISWACWAHGCDTPGYETAGMQQLVDVVRASGAHQPVMLAPLGWAGSPGGPAEFGTNPDAGWLRWRPVDADNAEILSVHEYNFSGCTSVSCWDSTIAPVARVVPVVMGEFGETNCSTTFDTAIMDWDDAHGVSYLAWAWNKSTNACGSQGPSVITNYAGSPTVSGTAIRTNFLAAGR